MTLKPNECIHRQTGEIFRIIFEKKFTYRVAKATSTTNFNNKNCRSLEEFNVRKRDVWTPKQIANHIGNVNKKVGSL